MATQWTAGITDGQTLYATDLNAIGAAAETFTPTWTASTTNPTLGNGTLSGKYFRFNKIVFCQIFLQIGSTTNVGSGQYRWALPVTAASPINSFSTAGVGRFYDASLATATLANVAFNSGATTYISLYYATNFFSSTAPVVPATSDEYHLSFWYEAA